ncbi:Gfo/Idh/MocA family protein [Thermofilum pendens]|uniref:Oxidoreductase domain protein n=1 Tax=Thermofilum pendens (strain DSM 2475 / Hrk 5) TaxID=368408 RepID=A1RY39_THEPD|nr:Gfo/Idh/MocA family oxidoreductase [Thermofilum pendens]ABL78119.1 oxidoreductase domain protein [Thermofilum pendens Hrk 5]
MGVNVAVVGVGRWGRNHVRVLSSLRGSLVGRIVVVDADEARASSVAKQFAVDAYYSSVEELVKDEKDLDAAVVAVPTVYHFEVASKLLNYADVLVEKPLAATLDEGYRLVELSRKLGRRLAVGHIERFNPVVGAAYAAVRGKEILSMESKRLGPGPAREYTLNLGVAHDLLVHDVDVVNMFLGEPPGRVFAYKIDGGDFPFEVEVTALYEYSQRRIATLSASWRTVPSYKHRSLTIRLPDSVIRVDYILRRIVVDRGVQELPRDSLRVPVFAEESYVEVSYLQEEPLKAELIDFLEAVKLGGKPRVDGLAGYVALKCVVKALESASKGVPVPIGWDEIEKLSS